METKKETQKIKKDSITKESATSPNSGNLIFTVRKHQAADYEQEINLFDSKTIEIAAFNYDGMGNAIVYRDGARDIFSPQDLRDLFFTGWYDFKLNHDVLKNNLTFNLLPDSLTTTLDQHNWCGFEKVVVIATNYDGAGGTLVLEDGEIGYLADKDHLEWMLASGFYSIFLNGRQVGNLKSQI